MKLIVCVDDQNGMAFNHRRQSQDRVLVERIEDLVADSTLRMAPYSQKFFSGENIVASSSYLSDADVDDYCFVEVDDMRPYEDICLQHAAGRDNQLCNGRQRAGWCPLYFGAHGTASQPRTFVQS